MRLSRRSAMTAAVGGVAAAPSMAKEAIAKMSMPAPMPEPWYGNTKVDYDAAPTKPPQDLIDQARAFARGEVPDEIIDNRTGVPYWDPCQDLRSVSPAAKRYFSTRHNRRREREKLIERAKAAIAHYDKTGMMHHIW